MSRNAGLFERAGRKDARAIKKIEEARDNISRAAELLGPEHSHLLRKMKALGIGVRE